MPHLLLVMLAASASAGVFLDVGSGLTMPLAQGHGWIRVFPDEQGWWLCHAAGGDYYLDHLAEDLAADGAGQVHLTGHTDLIDHGIAACPDGGYLHASFSQVEGADTLHTFRYDGAWTRTSEHTVFENDAVARASDLPVLCSNRLRATAYSEGYATPFILAVLDDQGALLRSVPLQDAPSAQGSAMLADPDGSTFLVIGTAMNGGRDLLLRRYRSDDASLVESRTLEVPFDESRRVFWPQGLIRVGDHHIVAHVVTTEASGVSADTGDIWLSAYDADWALADSVAVVEEPTEWWAWMRPGLARKGDRLVVSFDNQNNLLLAEVTLDLEALGVGGHDSGGADTGPDAKDSATDPTDDDGGDGAGAPGCGCGSGAPAPFVALLGLLGSGWSQRRGGPARER